MVLRTIRNIGGSALVVLAVTLVVVGCPDSTPDINGIDADAGATDTDINTDTDGDGDGTDTDGDDQSEPPTEVPDTTTPAAIRDIRANAIVGSADVNLQWVGSASDTAAMVRISWMSTTDSGDMLIPHQDGIQDLTISALIPEIEYVFSVVVIDTADTESEEVTVTQRTLPDTTAPESARHATAIPLANGTKMLVRWTDSSSTDVSTVDISWSPTATGIPEGSTPAAVGAEQIIIPDLTVATPYTLVITVADVAGNSTAAPVDILPPVDANANGLIDINWVEQLYNVRYNLAGSSYKTSDDDSGVRCGTNAATPCSGYELIRDLDFADSTSYASGQINPLWRPNTLADTSGTALPQTDAIMARNSGWDPIGSCNSDVRGYDDPLVFICNDSDDTPLATHFEGNGYTISNLYARNTHATTAAAIGLFASINHRATIHNIGIVDTAVYGGSAARDYIGGLTGSNGGTITASYAHGSTADGGAGATDFVGGLVGFNTGIIAASYTTGSVVTGGIGTDDCVGGLVGMHNSRRAIVASYAHDSVVDGGMGNNDHVGGLVGVSDGPIVASHASGTITGGADNEDTVGGLVGSNRKGKIIASYASGTVTGGAGTGDRVGGLVGYNIHTIPGIRGSITASGITGRITASYTTATADGGTDTGDRVGRLVGDNTFTYDDDSTLHGNINASYGFGITSNADTPGHDGTTPPKGITGSGIAAARQLTVPSLATMTGVDSIWNNAVYDTAAAWDFGTTAQAPALHYADYDGNGTDYGCGDNSTATIVIPSSVPDGAGGTIAVNCGTTLLPEQAR